MLSSLFHPRQQSPLPEDRKPEADAIEEMGKVFHFQETHTKAKTTTKTTTKAKATAKTKTISFARGEEARDG